MFLCVCVCVCVSKSVVLGILFLVEFGLLVTDFGLVAIQATHTAHFNRDQQIVLQLWYSFLSIPFFTIYPWYSGAGGGRCPSKLTKCSKVILIKDLIFPS